MEFLSSTEKLHFYSATAYRAHLNSDLVKFDSLNEIIIYPFSNFWLGSLLIHSVTDWKTNRDWQTRTCLGYNIRKISLQLSWEYHNVEGSTSNWGNRKYELLTIFNLTDIASIGLEMGYFNPTYEENFYQVGLQGKIRYETD